MTVTEDGTALIVLPMRASEREAEDLFHRHRGWIERQRVRLETRRISLATRPSLAAGRVLIINGVAQILRANGADERAALERRLRRQARTVISERTQIRASELGVEVRAIQIRDQTSRWGSASRRGTLSFSWRLILCPPETLDYVVVHELAHLRYAGHGIRFWRLVERHFGDPREPRRWLREHHEEVRAALD